MLEVAPHAERAELADRDRGDLIDPDVKALREQRLANRGQCCCGDVDPRVVERWVLKRLDGWRGA